MVPAFTYQIPFLPNSGWQAISSADRTLCAAVSALAYLGMLGAALGGIARQLTPAQVEAVLIRYLVDEEQLMEARVRDWAHCIASPELNYIDMADVPLDVDGMVLSEYQRFTIAHTPRFGAVLNLGCGLGKTLTTVATLLALAKTTGIQTARCWIVCPVNAYSAWQPYLGILRTVYTEVNLISMDSLHKAVGASRLGGVIVFDEVHLLGETKARRTESAHTVRAGFDCGLVLTGTMNHGGIHKSLSILDLAIPGAAWFGNKWRCGEYLRCLVKKQLGSRTVTNLARPVGPAKELFFEFISRYTIVMTKRSEIVRRELNLPEQHIHTVEVGDCSISLDKIAADFCRQHIAATGEIPQAAMVAHALARLGVEEKLDYLMSEMDPPGGESLVIFAGYVESLDMAEQRMKAAGYTYVRVDGSVTGADRAEAKRKFQSGEVQVFLGQEHAAGISMDLFKACVSVTLDTNWSGSDYAQMLARTCRRGQTETCHHIDLAANKFQTTVLTKLRAAEDFDAQCVEWNDIKRATMEATCPTISSLLPNALQA